MNNGVNDTGAKEEKIQHRMFVHISPIYCITKTDIILLSTTPAPKRKKIQHRMFVHISPIYCITKTDITGAKEEKIQHRMLVHISQIYCRTQTDIISVVNVTGPADVNDAGVKSMACNKK